MTQTLFMQCKHFHMYICSKLCYRQCKDTGRSSASYSCCCYCIYSNSKYTALKAAAVDAAAGAAASGGSASAAATTASVTKPTRYSNAFLLLLLLRLPLVIHQMQLLLLRLPQNILHKIGSDHHRKKSGSGSKSSAASSS